MNAGSSTSGGAPATPPGGRTPPPEIDVTIAHPARIYDFLLGGKDNYESDRAVAEQMIAINPLARPGARRNREFLLRAVRTMVVDLGITQILDLGAGIPTAPNVHQVARAASPETVVAYVDNDPIVLAHDRALLSVVPGVITVLGDFTDPPSVLDHPEVGELIDWSRPVGVVMASVFHFVPDELDPLAMVAAYRDRMAPGSAVAISMLTSEGADPGQMSAATRDYRATQGLTFRDRQRIAAFFAGFDMLEPGLVHPADWRPTQVPPTDVEGSTVMLAGVGVRPPIGR